MLPSRQVFVHNSRTPLFVMRLPYKTEPNWILILTVRNASVGSRAVFFLPSPFPSRGNQTVSIGRKYTGWLTCLNLSLPPMLAWLSCWVTTFLIFLFRPLIIIWDGCVALPVLWISSSCCSECQQLLNGSRGHAIYWSFPCCAVLRNGHGTEYESYQLKKFNFKTVYIAWGFVEPLVFQHVRSCML